MIIFQLLYELLLHKQDKFKTLENLLWNSAIVAWMSTDHGCAFRLRLVPRKRWNYKHWRSQHVPKMTLCFNISFFSPLILYRADFLFLRGGVDSSPICYPRSFCLFPAALQLMSCWDLIELTLVYSSLCTGPTGKPELGRIPVRGRWLLGFIFKTNVQFQALSIHYPVLTKTVTLMMKNAMVI